MSVALTRSQVSSKPSMGPDKEALMAFSASLVPLSSICRPPLSEAQVYGYFESLQDIPFDVLLATSRKIAATRKYPTFPMPGEIREEALDITRDSIAAGEAWRIAISACGRCDVDIKGSVERAFANVPPIVIAAVWSFGFRSLYSLPNNAVETARAQFFKVFNEIAEKERRTGLLPASVREQIALIGSREKRILPFADNLARSLELATTEALR